MTFERIKTDKKTGRQYRYLETRWREGGKVKSKSVSLGPVGGRKRRRFASNPTQGLTYPVLGLPFMIVYDLVSGNRVDSFKARMARSSRGPNALDREKQRADQRLRQLDALWGIDKSNAGAFHASMRHMTVVTMQDYWAGQHAIRGKCRPTPAANGGGEKEKRDQEALARFNESRKSSERPPAPEKSYAPKGSPTDEEEAMHATWSANMQAERDEQEADANATDADGAGQGGQHTAK